MATDETSVGPSSPLANERAPEEDLAPISLITGRVRSH